MGYVQTRQVTTGQMITCSFEQLNEIKRELAIYFGAFFAAGLLVDLIEPLRGPVSIAATIGYFVGQYWLYRMALLKAGVIIDDRWKVFSFFGMALILAFPIMIGMNFLIIPGLLLAAKWVMAPAFLVAEKRDLFQAMGDSWRASENNLVSLTLAFTVLCVIWIGLVVVVGGISNTFGSALSDLGGRDAANAFEWLGIHALPVLLMGLSLTAYRALADEDSSLVAVFE
ncbi:MAG: hypothetical protein ACX930_03790 [Erythrobacter sp.]